MTSPGRVPSLGTRSTLDLVERFSDAAERFGVVVATVDLQAPVRTCPGWTVYDLVVHLGNIHAWAATIVETGRSAPEQDDQPRSRRGRVVSEWYAGKAEDLYEVLRAVDPDRPCWNFAFGEGSARFWQRRQAHEATVHGIDLDTAAGHTTPVSPLLAEDGVDEVLRVFGHRMHQRGRPARLTAPLTVTATDTARAWTLLPDPSGPAAGPPRVIDRAQPDADQVSAPAETLYRVLWKRAPTEDLARTGGPVARERINDFLGSPLVP